MIRRVNAGFTLIELLVVITIIAILAAILFPVFASAREKARQTSCLSNEKSLGLAFSQYAQDYDEAMPISMTQGGNGGCWSNQTIGFGWAGQVWPYNKSLSIYSCLSDTSNAGNRDKVSYGYNRDVPAPPFNGQISKWISPSQTVLLFEAYGTATDLGRTNFADNWNTCGVNEALSPAGNGGDTGGPGFMNRTTGKYDTGIMGNPPRTLSNPRNPTGRHNGGSNFLLADGHAKWIMPSLVSAGNAPTGIACDQDACGAGTAASTDQMGKAPKGFVATFSPY